MMFDPVLLPELTATIDACNKANVSVYSLDFRALATSVPGGSALGPTNTPATSTQNAIAPGQTQQNRPRFVLASYSLALPDPQKPGGGGGAPGGGGKPGGGGGTGGGTTGGGKGTGGTPSGDGTSPPSNNSYNNFYNNL